ncbi:MAG: hypothetical protein MUD14_12730 [Hydrococcus sp. Prado102]|jgi:hypothetical protein|nr:hypothetical protein [Hydrococcus sp. Prado102]
MIDDYEKAIALTEKMEAQLPISVYATPQLLKTMEEKGEKCDRDRLFTIEKVHYSGDMGGITCALTPDSKSDMVFAVSLTHLRIPDDHPLASEIQSYQKKRTLRLAIADGKMGRAKRLAKQDRKKKGFGG